MLSFISAFITFSMELISIGYRSFLIWCMYPFLTDVIPELPTISYLGMYLIVAMIRFTFLDFTDVIDIRVIDKSEEVDE